MTEQPARKLAVILHADVIGSTVLVQRDESLAHSRIVDAFKCFSKTIETHGGIAHEIRGDALLAEFSRASDAVTAAMDFQKNHTDDLEKLEDGIRAEMRVGIAMGEVVIGDNTMTGAGVVMAQRLEQLAKAGGVVIQGAAYETLPKRLPFQFHNLGEQQLKGFEETVRAYRVITDNDEGAVTKEAYVNKKSSSSLASDKPSIVVLPFKNMSGDPEQAYFSDGITEDIITELSRFRTLFVIARNSSFRFKGENVDIKEISEKLGVQYVVEGSVRRAGNRVRITAQLVEAETGNHIWAEKFDRSLHDIFELQDEVTQSIVAVLPGRVQEDVVDRSLRKPTENMTAYELMLQGKAYRDQLSAVGNAKARECCEKAIALDSRYARAYMYLSDSHIVDLWLGLASKETAGLALQLAREAARLDGNDIYIQDHLGFGYLSERMWTEAESQFDKTMAKIVNEAESMAWCGYACLLLDKRHRARQMVLDAMRLDPLHPPTMNWILGQIYYYDERYEDVVSLLIGEALLNSLAHGFLAGAYAQLGRQEEARRALELFIRERHAEFASRNIIVESDTVESLAGSFRMMWRNSSYWELFADGLRKAGLADIDQQVTPIESPARDGRLDMAKSKKPSIAVLPFDNLSGDPDQGFFADGVAEDITTALSRFHDLLVIARNSAFTYRGSSVDIRQVGRELGVEYVLEGSVRAAANRVRISAQLIEAESGNHVWAEKFDRSLDDVFEVQDEITTMVASTVGQQLRVAETRKVSQQNIFDLDYRKLVARAQWHMDQMTPEDFSRAREISDQAIELQPDQVAAYSMRAYVNIMELVYGWGKLSSAELMSNANEAALTGVRLDPDDEAARTYLGAVSWMLGKHDDAIESCETVLGLNPNFTAAIGVMGITYAYSGKNSYQKAVKYLDLAIRLSPNDPWLQFYYAHRGTAEFFLEKDDLAIEWYLKSLQRNPDLPNTLRMLMASYALNGDLEKAREYKDRVMAQNPDYSIADLAIRTRHVFRHEADFEHALRGMRLVGIPEN